MAGKNNAAENDANINQDQRKKCYDIFHVLWIHKKSILIVLVPLLLLPLPLLWSNEEFPAGGSMAYCLALMAVYWVLELLPLPVTAMMPVFLFPLMQIATADETCEAYFNDVQFLVIGGLLIAIAIERWNVHERVALSVLMLVGAKLRWIMLGFMLVTAILSMFISNTASTAMMIPIANAILDEIRSTKEQNQEDIRRESKITEIGVSLSVFKKKDVIESLKRNSVAPISFNLIEEGSKNQAFVEDDDERTATTSTPYQERVDQNSGQMLVLPDDLTAEDLSDLADDSQVETEKRQLAMDKMMLLAVAWSANLGGLGMLTGTAPNLVLKGHIDKHFNSELTFLNWSAFCLPTVFIFLVFAWVWLQVWFLGFKELFNCQPRSQKTGLEKRIEKLLRGKYESLGKIRFAEVLVVVLFIVLVILWFTSDLGFVEGYSSIFKRNETMEDGTTAEVKYVRDAVPAILIPSLLFVLPSTMPLVRSHVPRLLDWNTAQEKMPWNVIMLLGGGFALAKGMTRSGLSKWLGKQLQSVLRCVPRSVLGMCISLVVTMTTEVASNTATTQIFTPIMSDLARETVVNPFNTLIPTTVSASFAFMLPVATPPNAIAFSYGKVSIIDMALPGIVMNLVGVLIIGLGMNTWGIPIFDLENPDWPIKALNNTINCS